MARGNKAGAKRGNYKKTGKLQLSHDYIVANSLKMIYTQLAVDIDVSVSSLYTYLRRNNIKYLRHDGSKSTDPVNMSNIKKVSSSKKRRAVYVRMEIKETRKSIIDRSAFTVYSNKQFL